MKEPDIEECPECGGPLESGFLQAPSFGICWTNDPRVKSGFMFGSKMEKLQKDWWGFGKLAKGSLPAKRCRRCSLIVFRYEAKTNEPRANQQERPIAGKSGPG